MFISLTWRSVLRASGRKVQDRLRPMRRPAARLVQYSSSFFRQATFTYSIHSRCDRSSYVEVRITEARLRAYLPNADSKTLKQHQQHSHTGLHHVHLSHMARRSVLRASGRKVQGRLRPMRRPAARLVYQAQAFFARRSLPTPWIE